MVDLCESGRSVPANLGIAVFNFVSELVYLFAYSRFTCVLPFLRQKMIVFHLFCVCASMLYVKVTS